MKRKSNAFKEQNYRKMLYGAIASPSAMLRLKAVRIVEGFRDYLTLLDEGFRDMLLRKIDEKHMTDAECYRNANIDRKLFNKIKNQPEYRPGKQLVLALAISLQLPLEA